ncbi:hypothetical protein B2H91_10490 [Clostridium botulinum]|uniref:hypothetical protein n=1 Tax=Clostridium botulinum TaxID=1491 RepID=UPI000A170C08|nr:hypothetical protein [Clostridium botulinum]AUN19033.1 hypothetical protein B2M06_16025 [Clostridium botulinum]OSA86411.1 hypothetical protein B2H91_10490 [Clostridium botulinum]
MNKLKYLYPIVSSLLALWVVNLFNIVKYFSFVPSEHRFDVCLALYLTIVQGLFTLADEYLKDKLVRISSKVQVIFYEGKQNKDININPVVCFNKETGVGEVKCSIKACGKTALLSNTELIIRFPNWVQVQPDLKKCELSLSGNDNLVYIHLKSFLTNTLNEEVKIEFNLPMVMNDYNGHRENRIKCEFKFINDNIKYKIHPKKYNTNSFKLISENI